MDFYDFWPQDWHQNDPKTTLTRSQTVAFFIFDLCFDLVQFFAPFWLHLGTLLAPQNHLKIDPVFFRKLCWANMIPKTIPRGPKTAPRGPKINPRPHQDRPRPHQDRPRWPQALPRGPQHASKRSPRGLQEAQNLPQRPQEPSNNEEYLWMRISFNKY